MKYTLVFGRSVKRDMSRIPSAVVKRVQAVLRSLEENPFPDGIKKLRGYEHIYRIRIGRNYRIIYEVTTHVRIITIIRVGHRKDIYRGM